MRSKLVAGNWKMHGRRAMARELTAAVAAGRPTAVEIAICPPALYLAELCWQFADKGVALGSQDVSAHADGAYTGEISAGMLAEIGCRYAIVGHSERRQYQDESDELVAAKFMAAQGAGLVPILCLGESLAERDAGATETVVARQLGAVLEAAG